jgi:5-methylcytosine-specific restriction endonuclease McrA
LIEALEEGVSDPKLRSRLQRATTLVLNADYTPMSVLPLELLPWKKSLKAVFLNKVDVLEVYEGLSLRSPSISFNIPSIVVNKVYRKHARKVQFTSNNVFMRDGYTCQYCGGKFTSLELTYDHLVPRRLGGQTNWENIVSSCSPCNAAKGDKPMGAWISPLGLKHPLHMPVKPTYSMLENRFKDGPLIIPDPRWNLYLSWTGPLWHHDPITGENIQMNGPTEHTDETLGF